MEQRINFTTKSRYAISEEDQKRFYITMALFRYKTLRQPDYNEETLLKQLFNDYRHLYKEINTICDEQPNCLTRNRLRKEIYIHYSHVKKIYKQVEREKAAEVPSSQQEG